MHNLALARTELARLIGKERLDPSSTWLESTVASAPIAELRGLLALIAIAMTALLLRSYRRTRSARRALLTTPGIVALIALGLASLLLAAQKTVESRPPAAALEATTVRSGPGVTYLELGRVEAGSKVRILGEARQESGDHAGWRQIRYSKTAVGWVPASSLLLL